MGQIIFFYDEFGTVSLNIRELILHFFLFITLSTLIIFLMDLCSGVVIQGSESG